MVDSGSKNIEVWVLHKDTPEDPESLKAEELDGICAAIDAEKEAEAAKKLADANR